MGQEIAHEDDDGGGDADKDGTGWVQYSSVRFHLYSPCAGTKSTHSVMKSSGILWKWVWRSAAPPKTINLSSCFVLNSLHQLARRSPEKNLMGHSPKLLVVQTCSTQFKIVVILCGMFWFELNLCWWTPYVLNQTVFCKMIVLLEKKSHVEFGGCISCISHKVYGANFWWNFYPQNFVSWWIGPNGFFAPFWMGLMGSVMTYPICRIQIRCC